MRWIGIAITAVATAFVALIVGVCVLSTPESDDHGFSAEDLERRTGAFQVDRTVCAVPDTLPEDDSLVVHVFGGVSVALPADLEFLTPSPNGALPGGASEFTEDGQTIVVTVLPSVSAYSIGPAWWERVFEGVIADDGATPTRAPLPTPRPAKSVYEMASFVAGERVRACTGRLALDAKAAAFWGSAFTRVSYEGFVELDDGRVVVVGVDDERDKTNEQRKLDFLAVVNSIRLTDSSSIAR